MKNVLWKSLISLISSVGPDARKGIPSTYLELIFSGHGVTLYRLVKDLWSTQRKVIYRYPKI